MAAFTISAEAAGKAIQYSSEAVEKLSSNMRLLDTNVNSNFQGLQDPSIKKYLELSEQMQEMLRQVGDKMTQVEDYCKKVIAWIQDYTET
ncbi:MAG: hypothetical protein IKA43_01445 [Clostridia bacterium]|nr:hypothetical protein [Clostridia bacterium]